MNAEFSAICDRILSSVLNGAGQGLLLVVLVAGALRFFRGTNAATRHAIEFGTLILLAILPLAHFCFGDTVLFPPKEKQLKEVLPVSLETAPPQIVVLLATGADSNAEEEDEEPTPGLAGSLVEPEVQSRPSDVAKGWSFELPNYASAVLVFAWCLTSGCRLARLAVQIFMLRVLKRDGLNAPDSVRELFSKLCVELKVSRAPQLRVTPKVQAPMAVGFKEPAVLLPENLGTDENRLEQILRHELAHVVRRDDWANLLQQTIRALLFFHPGVIWASRRISVDREIACDDHVLNALQDRKSYALSLAEFARRSQSHHLIAAPAAWSQQSHLKQRINMILDTKRNSSPRLARGKTGLLTIAAIVIATLSFQAMPRLTLAQPVPEPAPAEPAVSADVHTDVQVSAEPSPASVSVSVTPVAPAAPRRPRISVSAAHAPAIAGISTYGGGHGQTHGLYAAADTEAGTDEGGPRTKARAGGKVDPVERRLERLEKMVESLVRRDQQMKGFQFDFKNPPNAGNFNFNTDDWAKMNEKIAKDAQKMAEKMAKDFQNRGDFGKFEEGEEGLNMHRKVLEEQKQALEKQVQTLERQIQKLEREQQRFERERDREEARKERDEAKRRDREEKELAEKQRDEQEEAKEKEPKR